MQLHLELNTEIKKKFQNVATSKIENFELDTLMKYYNPFEDRYVYWRFFLKYILISCGKFISTLDMYSISCVAMILECVIIEVSFVANKKNNNYKKMINILI